MATEERISANKSPPSESFRVHSLGATDVAFVLISPGRSNV